MVKDPIALIDLATSLGLELEHRLSVRLPARGRVDLEAWIRRAGKTGCLLIGYSQGAMTWVKWEETQA